METRDFKYSLSAEFNRYAALLESMSFVKTAIARTGKNPIDDIREELQKLWGKKTRVITWNNHMLLGKKPEAAIKLQTTQRTRVPPPMNPA